jgi:hypothetical protein
MSDKQWWNSPEEERTALDDLYHALVKQANDKDYRKKMHVSLVKVVDKVYSNENFQKMITGMFTPPIFIGDNSDTHDELEKLLKEDEARHTTSHINYKKTIYKKPNNKRRKTITNKLRNRTLTRGDGQLPPEFVTKDYASIRMLE